MKILLRLNYVLNPYITTYWESLDFCPSPESLKWMKKLFSDYGLHTTKTISCEVSYGVVVGTVWQATWMGVQTPQTCCVSCCCLFWRQFTQGYAAFNFCPNIRVHPGAPMLGYIQVPCTTSQKRSVRHLRVHRLQKKYCIFYANNMLIAKFTRQTSHTQIL